MEYFVKLFDTQALPYTVVIDKASQSYDLPKDKIVEITPKHQFRENQQQFDIEDLVENELLASAFIAVHPSFGLDFVLSKLGSGKKAATILGECLQGAGKNKDDLDKVRIAREVIKLVKQNPKQYEKTFENFEDLLQKIQNKFRKLLK